MPILANPKINFLYSAKTQGISSIATASIFTPEVAPLATAGVGTHHADAFFTTSVEFNTGCNHLYCFELHHNALGSDVYILFHKFIEASPTPPEEGLSVIAEELERHA